MLAPKMLDLKLLACRAQVSGKDHDEIHHNNCGVTMTETWWKRVSWAIRLVQLSPFVNSHEACLPQEDRRAASKRFFIPKGFPPDRMFRCR